MAAKSKTPAQVDAGKTSTTAPSEKKVISGRIERLSGATHSIAERDCKVWESSKEVRAELVTALVRQGVTLASFGDTETPFYKEMKAISRASYMEKYSDIGLSEHEKEQMPKGYCIGTIVDDSIPASSLPEWATDNTRVQVGTKTTSPRRYHQQQVDGWLTSVKNSIKSHYAKQELVTGGAQARKAHGAEAQDKDLVRVIRREQKVEGTEAAVLLPNELAYFRKVHDRLVKEHKLTDGLAPKSK